MNDFVETTFVEVKKRTPPDFIDFQGVIFRNLYFETNYFTLVFILLSNSLKILSSVS
jgi:hypothetical protein